MGHVTVNRLPKPAFNEKSALNWPPRHLAFDLKELKADVPLQLDMPAVFADGLSHNGAAFARKRTYSGAYIIMYAAAAGNTGMLGTWIENGTPATLPDFANDRGLTPLMAAAARGHAEAVEMLASNPLVNVNRQTGDGWTALHYAAWFGHPDCVKALLKHRADFTIMTLPETVTFEPDIPGIDAYTAAAGYETQMAFLQDRHFLKAAKRTPGFVMPSPPVKSTPAPRKGSSI